jgi:hypothetical protein
VTETKPAQAAKVFDALLAAVEQAGAYNQQDQVRPAVILWTDKERQWEPLSPRLREALPQFLTLGGYDPSKKTGPAIWIRCMVGRTLPEAAWPQEVVPVLYLPGVSRHELRAVEDCPRPLQPLAEFQFRGVWFTQENTRDWTIFAFLASRRGGLELDIASDQGTREAMLHALGKLADTPVAELRGRRLQAADFHGLLQPDPVKQLLRWMDDPGGMHARSVPQEWNAFLAVCRDRYSFDPEKDGELAAAEKLGSRGGSWGSVWERFAEAPAAYQNIPEFLRRAKPDDEGPPLFFRRECWPQCNERDEGELRGKLMALGSLAPNAVPGEIERLESTHSVRRTWVWAKLDRAPLAVALEPLACLARATRRTPGGEDAKALAASYASEGWRADAAALGALATVSNAADVEAVKVAVRALYKPWLEVGAERFQDMVRERPIEEYGDLPRQLAAVEPGTCILFADALRLDLGKRLRAGLEAAGLLVEEVWRWVPIPPVTSTAKPAASPVADLLSGRGTGSDQFQPAVRETGQALSIERFRELLAERGFQDLRGEETGEPTGRAWTEYGEIDERGHTEGWKLAWRIAEAIEGLVDRVRTVLDAGWREVRVVTDHGWLLLPGGLPKVEMPHYLVDSRWSRCGALKPGSQVDLPTAPWYWDANVPVVLAPGIGSFRASTEYSHGSLSLQECVVLDLTVRPREPERPPAALESVRWTGMRCRIRVSGAAAGWHVDLRTKAADPSSSLAKDGQAKPVGADGEASLVVDDPNHAGTAATVVLLDPDNRVVARRNTTVGGEE